ncbi:MAG: hypothetical protein JO099_13460 [Acidobacteriia bacterium]|nr:hypothetical protein [Terriglobia bacterium]
MLACILSMAAAGQVSFHAGVEAGVPITDTLISSSESLTSPPYSPATNQSYSLFNRFHSETKRLLIGPTLRVETPSGIGFELDALYQRIDSDFSAVLLQPMAPAQQAFQQTTANRWQVPVLGQYSRKLSGVRWFAGAGPSLSHISQVRPQIMISSPFGPLPSSATWGGVTAGGGVDLRVFDLHLRPEFRYSHWFAGSSAVTPTAIPVFLTSVAFPFPATPAGLAVPIGFSFPIHQEEASFLLGVTF